MKNGKTRRNQNENGAAKATPFLDCLKECVRALPESPKKLFKQAGQGNLSSAFKDLFIKPQKQTGAGNR